MNVLQQELDEFRRTPDGKVIQGCSHTSRVLSHKYRNQVVMSTYAGLKKYDGSYDAIACCGTSGLMVVPQIAELLKKNIIVVRKNTDGYSDFMVEGASTRQYIIIDDLVCSGGTVKHIIKNIKEEIPIAKCMGVWSYMKDQCAYRTMPEYCKRDLGVPYL
jgi:adenine/guanine phosphoribosyltransferase-like PRPP-binding protein|tara:strand:+ start:1296 stop:1775 length:480 start_codon:yes stop_codon:yes gene_type:complete